MDKRLSKRLRTAIYARGAGWLNSVATCRAGAAGCALSNLPWWIMTICSTSALTMPEYGFPSENT